MSETLPTDNGAAAPEVSSSAAGSDPHGDMVSWLNAQSYFAPEAEFALRELHRRWESITELESRVRHITEQRAEMAREVATLRIEREKDREMALHVARKLCMVLGLNEQERAWVKSMGGVFEDESDQNSALSGDDKEAS
jgi:hypothetical protein